MLFFSEWSTVFSEMDMERLPKSTLGGPVSITFAQDPAK